MQDTTERYTIWLTGPSTSNPLIVASEIEAFEWCDRMFSLGKDFHSRVVTRSEDTWDLVGYSRCAATHCNLTVPDVQTNRQIWYIDCPPWLMLVKGPEQKLLSPYRFYPWTPFMDHKGKQISWRRLRHSVSTYLLVQESDQGWECYFVEHGNYANSPKNPLAIKNTQKEAQAYLDAELEKRYKHRTFDHVFREVAEQYGLHWERQPSPFGGKSHGCLVGDTILLHDFSDPEEELLAFFHELGHFLVWREPEYMPFSVTLIESHAWILGLRELFKRGYTWDVYNDPPFKWVFKAHSSYYFGEADRLLFDQEALVGLGKDVQREIKARAMK